ncbi:uncharacterized protein BDV14DRAFT_116705 [Aspergillus stella-maris]|uniref:uncharacterized protein n=1 Tax=Aspergillus stella-maris TaxID=1810926 RepID=UPI003CCE2772
MDPEEAPPPPYSAVDPLLAPSASNNRNATTSSPANHSLLQLRGGDARLHGRSGPAAAPLVGSPAQPLPAHFTSAAAYFAERPAPTDIEHGQQILEHSMTVYPRSQAKDFPRRPRCWSPRMDNIAQQDWDMFLRHLYPPSLGLASSSAELPRQVRAEIRRDRKDRPQETDDERERRIATVMKEWNQYFFEPRAVRIVFFYVTDLRSAPISPLCPRCYPAATRATQENRNAQTPEAGRGHPLPGNMYPATLGYPGQAPYPSQAPGPYGYPTHAMPSPFPPQGGTGFFHPANPHAYQNPYPQHPPWGWNNQYPQQQDSSSLKGGPLGWFSNLATKAQMYGDRISEQAWQYGDQLSYYGRQVEEQALAHGRWIEEQAGLGSRKVESAFSGWNPPQQGIAQPPTPQPQAQEQAQQPSQPHTQSRSQPQSQSHAQTQPPALTRRASTSSTTSTSSLSSISSISTTSDLSSSDLATVRAQLLSLDAHHDRDLYDAAKELRRQLDALRDTRRQARIAQSNRTTTSTMGGRWRTGWGSSSSKGESSHLGGLGRGLGMGKSSWGRWESPQDRQRNAAERKAAKDELRATRKAFRDVLRRAREEQKERRRVKRSRRAERRVREWELQSQNQNQGQTERAEQPSVSVSISGQQPEPASLEDQLQNLELGTTRNEPGSRPTARRADTDENADAHSESSAVSLVSTPSTSSDEEGDGKKKKGKEQALNKELK